MEELFHPLFNANPSTCAFNSILFCLLMEFVYIYTPSSEFSTSFLLSNCSETCYWIFYCNNNLSLASPVSFCFICLLPFSDKLIKADSLYFLPSFHYLSLTLKSTPDWPVPSLLLKNFHAKVSGDHHQKPFGLFSSLSHQQHLISFWPSPLWAILACWDTIFLWFLFYFYSCISFFFFCWIL